jgi:uncharacterized LabA/DUF88 family protein
MMFVDGENFTIRGQELAQRGGLPLASGPFYLKDVFLWFPHIPVACTFNIHDMNQERGVRAYYYTSVVGDDDRIGSVKESLWEIGFEPEVFKRQQGQQRSKGVDISLTVDLLGHAYRNGFDAALLVAGDGDYVPLVKEVKRMGKIVDVAFFRESGLNPSLRLACDTFFELDGTLIQGWKPTEGDSDGPTR